MKGHELNTLPINCRLIHYDQIKQRMPLDEDPRVLKFYNQIWCWNWVTYIIGHLVQSREKVRTILIYTTKLTTMVVVGVS